jgi:hypothetical protein
MSKNELRAIAKISLIGVGLYVLMQALVGTMTSLPFMLIVAHNESTNASTIIVLAIYMVLLLGTTFLLFRLAGYFSNKIVASEPADDMQISWLAAAFRIISVTSGLLFTFWTAYSLIAILSVYSNQQSGSVYLQYKAEIVKYIVLLILSIYLAYGAPHFVRWQVKKTLKQCGKAVEQQKAWD